mmetsp:Transcript_37081/g.106127  ORF Transcript_37081/g.106127 Transcript_37081/m.106127 type:complete len:120 (+) Transcript_37081:1512-1871(+)
MLHLQNAAAYCCHSRRPILWPVWNRPHQAAGMHMNTRMVTTTMAVTTLTTMVAIIHGPRTGYTAFVTAGYNREKLLGSFTGVFVGGHVLSFTSNLHVIARHASRVHAGQRCSPFAGEMR